MNETFLTPTGELTPELVQNTLRLVIQSPQNFDIVKQWSALELLLVYDWAIREHLSASDNPIERRPKPYLVTLVEWMRVK